MSTKPIEIIRRDLKKNGLHIVQLSLFLLTVKAVSDYFRVPYFNFLGLLDYGLLLILILMGIVCRFLILISSGGN